MPKPSLKLGVVMDPIATITPHKDSTLAMLLAAQARQWPLYYMEQADLFVQDGMPYASMRSLTVKDDNKDWFTLGAAKNQTLTDLDVILMRKDPLFDMEYIYTTYILELAEKQGTLIVNKPQSLRDANEKLFTSWFPDCCVPTLVTRNKALLLEFVKKHEQTVFKPLDSMGGRSIFLVRDQDPNLQVIIETLSQFGAAYMMAQKFIPAIKTSGDKRILLINGKPVPYALARIPAGGDIRGNLAAGGSGVGVELSQRDYQICERIGLTLRAKGLIFVGIDVIGDYLTEINVTSPTCIREIEQAFPINISEMLLDCIIDLASKNSR